MRGLVLAGLLLLGACGIKGPPRPPLEPSEVSQSPQPQTGSGQVPSGRGERIGDERPGLKRDEAGRDAGCCAEAR